MKDSPIYGQLNSTYLLFTQEEAHCLRFWYYMDTREYAQISVSFYDDKNVKLGAYFIVEGNKGKKWNYAQTSIHQYLQLKISIDVMVTNINVTDIAFDDIVVTPGDCPSVCL